MRYDNKECQEFPLKIQIPPALLANCNKLNVLTSFGLICLYCYSTSFPRCLKYAFFDIYLWNPFVQKFKTLPDVPLIPAGLFSCRVYWKDLAFGYVPQIDDYRVVTIVCYDGGKNDEGDDMQSCFICVFSLATNSWKKIIVEDDYYGIQKIDSLFEPVILNGTAFWRGIRNLDSGFVVLLYFDTMNNELGSKFLPTKAYMCSCTHPYMCQSGQSIVCIVKDYRGQQEQVHLCALKEGPMNKFYWQKKKKFYWEKKISVSLDEIARLQFVGSRNNGELILPQLYQCHLVSYKVDKDEVNDFVQLWYRWFSHGIARGKNNYDFEDRKLDILAVPFYVYPFVESLVLLDAN